MSLFEKGRFGKGLENSVDRSALKGDIYLYLLDFDFPVGASSSDNIPAWLRKQDIYSIFDLSENKRHACLITDRKLNSVTEEMFKDRNYINSFHFFGKV